MKQEISIIKGALDAMQAFTSQQKKEALDILSGKTTKALKEKTEGPVLLTQAQAAQFLGLSRSTIWRMTQTGELTPIQIHGSKRYRKVDLEKLAGLQ